MYIYICAAQTLSVVGLKHLVYPGAATGSQYCLLLAPGCTRPWGHGTAPGAGTDHITYMYMCMCMHTHRYQCIYTHLHKHTCTLPLPSQTLWHTLSPPVANPSCSHYWRSTQTLVPTLLHLLTSWSSLIFTIDHTCTTTAAPFPGNMDTQAPQPVLWQ